MLLQSFFELFVGFLILFQAPQAFGAQITVGCTGQPRETCTSLGQLAAMAEAAAVVEFLGRQRENY
jgi:hypothetical protein